MRRDIDKLRGKTYDLIVIGGGINGAAAAYLAAARGLRVALLEKGDFASGTSSRSSKLIHGGMRYLENFQFQLVYEALKERSHLLAEAPHLVWPLRFLIPVYRGDKRPLWMMRLGVLLYDLLSARHRIEPHRVLNASDVFRLEPGLSRDGLCGGIVYSDAQMDDARLCLENVLAAAHRGADTANYAEVVSFLKLEGKAVGVMVRDKLDLHRPDFVVRARKIICAAGPWANKLLKMDDPAAAERVRTTKGVHILYPGKLSCGALLIPARRDNRVFFVLPWMGNTLIGTTDTDYTGDPDQVRADPSDIQYLVEETRRIFPGLELRQQDFRTHFAGLRPLVRHEGDPSKISREHAIFETPSGILFITGGKYTTYRVIASDCVDRIRKGKSFDRFSVHGAGVHQETPEVSAARYGVSPAAVRFLRDTYGVRAFEVLELIRENPGLKENLLEGIPILKAQVTYAVQSEFAETVEDVLSRRLSLEYRLPRHSPNRRVLENAILEVCPGLKPVPASDPDV